MASCSLVSSKEPVLAEAAVPRLQSDALKEGKLTGKTEASLALKCNSRILFVCLFMHRRLVDETVQFHGVQHVTSDSAA